MEANRESIMASRYRDTLDCSDRVRYDAKLSLIGNRDPHSNSNWPDDVSLLPSTTYIDIMNYLVFLPSPYTMKDLRAYKARLYTHTISLFADGSGSGRNSCA